MRTNTRKYSRLILTVLLVAMFIVAAFALVACNKKQAETTTGTSTSTLPVTGQTVLNLDNVKAEESVTLATSYEDVTLPAKYTNMGAYLNAPNGLLVLVVYDTESTDTFGNDYYLYDWRVEKDKKRSHASKHPYIAAEQAERDFKISKESKKIINSHMWPINFKDFPNSKEARILTLADKAIATVEFMSSTKSKKKHREETLKEISTLF